jgi:hypothetical protein
VVAKTATNPEAARAARVAPSSHMDRVRNNTAGGLLAVSAKSLDAAPQSWLRQYMPNTPKRMAACQLRLEFESARGW